MFLYTSLTLTFLLMRASDQKSHVDDPRLIEGTRTGQLLREPSDFETCCSPLCWMHGWGCSEESISDVETAPQQREAPAG